MTSAIETYGYTVIVPHNDHEDATLSASGTALDDFPVENTQNTIRDRVWRSNGLGTVTITGVLPATRVASAFSFFRHTAHGASVRLQLYSDAGATSQVYDSGTVATVWYVDSDPYVWSEGSNDPLISTAPFRKYFNETSYRSYKITFSSTPTYYSYFQVSTINLGRAFQINKQPKFGLPEGIVDIADKNRSLGGSLRSNSSDTWRTMTLDLIRVRDYERATWLKIKRRLGTGRAFMPSLYPGDGTELERDYMGLWKFAALDPIVRDVSLYTQRLQLEEC